MNVRTLEANSVEPYKIYMGSIWTFGLTNDINNAKLKKLDNRILRLRNLAVLNLENNNLKILPDIFGASLPNLTELHLGNNSLGETKDWRWIVNKNMSKQLKLLDLSSNQIDELPDKLVKLENLVTLKLNDNALNVLPKNIGCLKKLRILSLNNNNILYLPRSFLFLRLELFDASNNPFSGFVDNALTAADFQKLPTLLDLSASSVISKRLHYSAETIPWTLVDYLESAELCVCQMPCFSSLPQPCIPYHSLVNKLAEQTVLKNSLIISVSVPFCSYRCYSKIMRRGVAML